MKFYQAIIVIIGISFFRVLSKTILGQSYYTNTGNAIAGAIVLGFIVFLCARFLKQENIVFFPNEEVKSKLVMVVVSFGFFLGLIAIILSAFETLFRIGENEFFSGDFIFTWDDHQRRFFLSVLIVAPIFEEFLIRGVFLQGFLKKYTPVLSIFFVTLIFTFMHFDKDDFTSWNFVITNKVFIALHCIFVSWIMIRTSNIRLVILLHFLWNLLTYLFPLVLSATRINQADPVTFFIFSSITLGASMYVLFRNYLYMKNNQVIFQKTS